MSYKFKTAREVIEWHFSRMVLPQEDNYKELLKDLDTLIPKKKNGEPCTDGYRFTERKLGYDEAIDIMHKIYK